MESNKKCGSNSGGAAAGWADDDDQFTATLDAFSPNSSLFNFSDMTTVRGCNTTTNANTQSPPNEKDKNPIGSQA